MRRGWRTASRPKCSQDHRAVAHICRASSKEINNRIAQIITIGPDRSFSAKPTELYAASASAALSPPADRQRRQIRVAKSENPRLTPIGLAKVDLSRADVADKRPPRRGVPRSVETARSRADHEEERYEKRARRRRGCRGILSLGLGSLRSVGRDQQGGRRLHVGGRLERGSDHQERRQAAHFRNHHPHRRQRLLRSCLCGRPSRRQRLRNQPDQARVRSADGRHPARNPDLESNRQRPDHQWRDHDDAPGRRL